MNDYTPTTEEVRESYASLRTLKPFYDPEHDAEVQVGRAAFDRWLAAHDAALIELQRDEHWPRARIAFRPFDSDCGIGVCPTGCSHRMAVCDSCAVEWAWGAPVEKLEQYVAEHEHLAEGAE